MKSNFIYKSILAVAILGMASCKPELKDITPTKGSADFSRYIAVGNSLTSGYADGGLFLEGQQNSYPLMIAEQMKAVGGGAFATPFFKDSEADGSGHLVLKGFDAKGLPQLAEQKDRLAVRPGSGAVTLFTKYTGDLNNYGVPGIKLAHITAGVYGNLNGFYERMLPTDAPGNTTPYLEFVTAKPYTFFSMWLGNNDILGYASSGGANPNDQPTPKAMFSGLYNIAVNKLTEKEAKGVVATIPDVLSTPYFNTVTLASLLAAVQVSAPTVKDIYIKTGAGATRPATAQDYFVLPFLSAGLLGVPTGGIPYGLHPLNPVDSRWVLDKDEAAIVADYTNAYNATIKSVAAAKGLALVDAYALLKEYGAGKDVNGIRVSAAFITGNIFSLDGIHLTPLGYSIVANEFIRSINSKYGSSIPIVDVTKYRGVKFP
ncbi:SGNH/GDSL hydrolase family protein [Pedobacter caeni]|uniref:GDSL-like Lipase/Acylhydrolase n=1 Tax=Pedobacter caeni TaxID=288992 RepID=A0A1M5DT24_9SPHI|nr:SGNH/GDSL hydrolase family protein [Pedobacter caeni]SHF70137.1 GDSL-like Lipase/Acylhydrolase [Pedobacter caeni]